MLKWFISRADCKPLYKRRLSKLRHGWIFIVDKSLRTYSSVFPLLFCGLWKALPVGQLPQRLAGRQGKGHYVTSRCGWLTSQRARYQSPGFPQHLSLMAHCRHSYLSNEVIWNLPSLLLWGVCKERSSLPCPEASDEVKGRLLVWQQMIHGLQWPNRSWEWWGPPWPQTHSRLPDCCGREFCTCWAGLGQKEDSAVLQRLSCLSSSCSCKSQSISETVIGISLERSLGGTRKKPLSSACADPCLFLCFIFSF